MLSSQVADDNYRALQSFFTKFPNFTQNEFFIFGESYGGIYAPTLSLRVATGKAKINFKVRRFMQQSPRCLTHQHHHLLSISTTTCFMIKYFIWPFRHSCETAVKQAVILTTNIYLWIYFYFQGFAVGNGISSFDLNDQSLIYFGYYHGLFGEE